MLWTVIAIVAGIVLVVVTGLLRRAGVAWAHWILLGVLIAGAGLIYWLGADQAAWLTFVCTVMTGALVLAVLNSLRRRRGQGPSS